MYNPDEVSPRPSDEERALLWVANFFLGSMLDTDYIWQKFPKGLRHGILEMIRGAAIMAVAFVYILSLSWPTAARAGLYIGVPLSFLILSVVKGREDQG